MIFTRLERGRWQQLHWGVYAMFTGPVPREAELWAALLRAGPGAVLSHLSAAELHELIDYPGESIYVTVPSTRRITMRGVVVRTSRRIAEATQPGREPPRTSVEETVFDLIELAETLDDACGWITRAVGRRLTTAERLAQALARRKKIRWRATLEDILAAAGDGIHSVLEYRYLRDVERAHGLPRSRHQVRVLIDGKTAYRDAYYEKYRLAVELDGRLAHPDEERSRDRHRDNHSGRRGHPDHSLRLAGRPRPPLPDRSAAGQDPATARLGGHAPPLLGRLPAREFSRLAEFSPARVNQDGRLRVSLNEARRKRDAEPRLLPGTRYDARPWTTSTPASWPS